LIILTDNDVLLKLATCRLLEYLPDALGVTISEIYVLNSVSYVVRKKVKRYGRESVQRVLSFVEKTSELGECDVDEQRLEQLLEFEDIDVGEALLFAAGAEKRSARVVTGDKRALRTLCKVNHRSVLNSLCGCVICLEQMVYRLIVHNNFMIVRERVSAARDVDKVVQTIAFSRGPDTTKNTAINALRSYTVDLRASTGELLIDGEEWI
jgi:hypothetical protein